MLAKMFVLVPVMYFILMLLHGCTSPTTTNPTNAEADSPIIFGEVVTPPYGCIKWRVEDKDNADC